MKYIIEQHKFFKLDEKKGMIQNLGNGNIEIVITDKEPLKNYKDNIVVGKNGTYFFECKNNQIAYVRNINYNKGAIYVSNINKIGENNINIKDMEDIFVKKNGNKILSDNNYTTRDKNKLSKLQENLGNKFKFYYCTKTEYETLDKKIDNSIIYLILDEETGLVEMKCYKAL